MLLGLAETSPNVSTDKCDSQGSRIIAVEPSTEMTRQHRDATVQIVLGVPEVFLSRSDSFALSAQLLSR